MGHQSILLGLFFYSDVHRLVQMFGCLLVSWVAAVSKGSLGFFCIFLSLFQTALAGLAACVFLLEVGFSAFRLAESQAYTVF